MRLVLAVLALSACGGPARPRTSPDNTPPPEPKIEDPAIARWRSLELTGADYTDKLAALDVEDEVRTAMARALLLAGDFACQDLTEEDQCGDVVKTMNPLSPAATFDDPCLRRALALWSLDQLGPEDAPAIEPALLEMAKLEAPETELQGAAFDFIPEGADELRLRMMTVDADGQYALDQVDYLVDDAAVVHAATALHLNTALMRLMADPEVHEKVLIQEISDEAMDPGTRMDLIYLFAEATDTASHDAIAAVADTEDDCALAALAAQTLADRGDPSRIPARPKSGDPSAHLRALCVLSQMDLDDRDVRLAAWIGPKGIDTIDHHDDAYWQEDPDASEEPWVDRDGDVVTEHNRGVTITTTHVRPADVDPESLVQPFSYERAFGSAWSCNTEQCVASLAVYRFVPAGKSMVIESIRLESYSGDDC